MEDRIKEIKLIANEFIGDHFDNLGSELTTNIIRHAANGDSLTPIIEKAQKKSVGGANLDLVFVVEMVFKTASFISACLTIYKELERRFKRKPNEEEIKQETENTKEASDVDNKEEIIKAVIQHEDSKTIPQTESSQLK